jgi:hypothetical protein
MTAWLDFALWTAFLVGVVVVVFDSTRRIPAQGLTKRRALVLSGCAVVSFAFGAAYYWMHVNSAELAAGFHKNQIKELPPDWGADQPLEKRQSDSLAYVSAVFLDQGVLLKHVDQSGSWVLYQPSQKAIAERESAVAIRTQLQDQSWGFVKIAWTWWLSCLFAAVFGYLAGRTHAAANSAAGSDAPTSARGSP